MTVLGIAPSAYDLETARLARRERMKGFGLVTIAALMWSTAGIFMRYLTLDVWTIQVARAFFGALSLILYLLWTERGLMLRSFGRIGGKWGLLLVPINTLGMMAYVQSLAWTTVANVMIVYAVLPFVVAGLAWVWIREPVKPRTIVASAIALSGVMYMVSASAGSGRLAGDIAAFVMVLSFAGLVVLSRRFPGMSMAAHSTLSGLLCAIVCLPLADLGSIKWVDLLILAAFGTITIGVANVIYMRGVRKVPAAEASLIGLLDTIFAPLWVWMIFAENPGDGAIIGGLVVLGAVIFQILGDMQGKRKKSGL